MNSQSREKSSISERLHAVNELAADFYRENMSAGRVANTPKQYLAKRGMNSEIIEKFKIGYAPKSWTALLDFLRSKGFQEGLLEKSGLVIKGKEGRYFDRFRDRIIFPIFDIRGKEFSAEDTLGFSL